MKVIVKVTMGVRRNGATHAADIFFERSFFRSQLYPLSGVVGG